MKKKLDTKTPSCWLVFGAVFLLTAGAASSSEHENASKVHYNEMQKKLSKYADDESRLRVLNFELDAQLKLEEFLIKFREAEHPKMTFWAPIVVSATVSGIVSLSIALLTRRRRGDGVREHSSQ
jgi:hypothetical protein